MLFDRTLAMTLRSGYILFLLIIPLNSQVRPRRRPAVLGDCCYDQTSVETFLDPMLGFRDELSSERAIALSFDPLPIPRVRILEFAVVCLSTGLARNTFSSISVIVRYECEGTSCGSVEAVNRTDQFDFDCTTEGGILPPTLEGDISIRTPDPNGTLQTALDEKCGRCYNGPGVDPFTHCAGKS